MIAFARPVQLKLGAFFTDGLYRGINVRLQLKLAQECAALAKLELAKFLLEFHVNLNAERMQWILRVLLK